MNALQAPNYWIFQTNPQVFRLKAALRIGALNTFALTSHKDKVKVGDKVILWQTGKEAACYGLATVRSLAEERLPAVQELPFFKTPPDKLPRVGLSLDYNLWNKPVDKSSLLSIPAFESFNAGVPGTNFTATQTQYEAIEQLIEQSDLANEPMPDYHLMPVAKAPLNQILYGPPGTGKTYMAVNHALSLIEGRTLEEIALEERQELRRRFQEYMNRQRIAFVSFHQSFSYEDFVEGIKPKARDGQISYAVEQGVFKQLCMNAMAALKRVAYQWPGSEEEVGEKQEGALAALPFLPDYILAAVPKYVLIIDEINRGNVPSIFGELITLIERDKRAGAREALEVVLPYSKEVMSIPPNLYIIATMNTTDRSAESMDIALRRRFAFQAVPAQPQLIVQHNAPMTAGIQLDLLLDAINQRIGILLGPEYAIGHAYFFGVADLASLKQVFAHHIIPLLEEYFFNDYGKIGLVLGKAFVDTSRLRQDEDPFAAFPHPLSNEYTAHDRYHLKPLDTLTETDFIHIYDKAYNE
jgi:5-methylcytosine-specific restriction endonuclease McrBC GTP-binding regulatory subunit McrB